MMGGGKVDRDTGVEQEGWPWHVSPRRLSQVDDLWGSVLGHVVCFGEFLVGAAGADDVGVEVSGELGFGYLPVGVELDRKEPVMQREGVRGLLANFQAEYASGSARLEVVVTKLLPGARLPQTEGFKPQGRR